MQPYTSPPGPEVVQGQSCGVHLVVVSSVGEVSVVVQEVMEPGRRPGQEHPARLYHAGLRRGPGYLVPVRLYRLTVDGTLIEAAASLKSFKSKGGEPASDDGDPGNPSVDFHGEKRRNKTHQSTTDPEARLFRKGKGKEAKLVFMAHALMENRNGLLTDFQVSEASGTAERDAVPKLLEGAKERGFHPRTLGGDKNYDTRDCVEAMRNRRVTPHVAQNTSGRRSAIDGRTTRHPGYRVSQRIRKRVEEIFGWMKTVGGFRKTRYRGVDKTGLAGYLVATAYNLVRMAKLLMTQLQEAPVLQAA